jgi:AcrR family transcriptional regulator
VTPDEPAAPQAADGRGGWREQAVARSLDPARARAEKRVQRFLDAALELMSDGGGKDFTVQQVVERSGQSLRSFYQYFAGKDELLLALLEESVRSSADHLERAVAELDDPMARLQAFVVEYHRICTPAPPKRRRKQGPPNPMVMAEFARQLLTEHPREAAAAFRPLMSIMERLLAEAAEAGALRDGLDLRRVGGTVLQAGMFSASSSAISGTSLRPDDDRALLDLLLHGIAS